MVSPVITCDGMSKYPLHEVYVADMDVDYCHHETRRSDSEVAERIETEIYAMGSAYDTCLAHMLFS